MKRLKSILALLLVAALCLTLLAACAKSEKTDETPKDDQQTTPDTPEESGDDQPDEPDTPDEPAEPAEPEEEDEPEEIAEIEFYLWVINTIESDTADEIAAAMNEITEPAIGVHVNLHAIQSGSYNQQLTMAISGGETVDLCSVLCVPPVDFPTMYAAGQLMNIDDLLNEYAPELLETVGDYMNAYQLDGGTFGVPCYRNYAGIQWWIMRTDVLEELGLTDAATSVTTFTEMEDILQQVKDNTDLWPIGGNQSVLWMPTAATGWYQDDFTQWDAYDLLGDGLYVVHADENGVVTNAFESDGFKFCCEKARDWFDAGYVWPDSQLAGEHVDTTMKQGILFSDIQPGEMDTAVQKKSSTGYDITITKMSDSMVDTGSVVKFGCGVPVTAAEPEAAVKFLNMLYTSSELMNLLDWGIEGRDYYITETGEADYIDGDANVPYHVQDFIFGNFFLVAPWAGSGADFRAESMEVLENTPVSWFLGMSFNTGELSDEIAAITAVKDEYYYTLTTGSYTEELHQDFLNKLSAAGVDDYLAEAQRQLDAFLGK